MNVLLTFDLIYQISNFKVKCLVFFRIDPRIRRSVYVVGIREGGEEEYEFLLNRFLTSNFANDQLEMLRGLGAARDAALLNRYV